VVDLKELAMNRTAIVAFAAAAAVAGLAFAQKVSVPSHPPLNLAGFSGNQHALPDAVRAIEASTGGRVVGILYNNKQGAPGYDVVLARGNRISFQRYPAPPNGKAALTDSTKPDQSLKWAGRLAVKDVQNAKIPLVEAIRTAEARRGAPAVAAGLNPNSTQPSDDVKAYNVVLLQGGAERRVAVDANTGQVIADPSAMSPF
jgi:hypothetical protein